MSNNAQQVTTGKPAIGGAVFRAPTTATLPTNASAALTGFADMGYISDDGMTRTLKRETKEIKAWGGDTVLAPQTSKEETVKLKFIEALRVDVLKAIHGDGKVSGSLQSGITIIGDSDELEEKAWVVDRITNGGYLDRLVIPRGKIIDIADIDYKDDEPVGFEVTIRALADTNGKTSYEYISDASGESGQSGSSGTSH